MSERRLLHIQLTILLQYNTATVVGCICVGVGLASVDLKRRVRPGLTISSVLVLGELGVTVQQSRSG